MTGAESILRTLVNCGVDVCFGNPGTTEQDLVAASEHVPGLKMVLGLFENVCTGAADGYSRMSGKAAATLLHLGPGLANGTASLHNAKRARSSIVNLVGQHPEWHDCQVAPHSMNVAALAGCVANWVDQPNDIADASKAAAKAWAESMRKPGYVATLAVPADVSWGEDGPAPEARPEIPAPPATDMKIFDEVVRILKSGEPTMILMGGSRLRTEHLTLANRIAQVGNTKLRTERMISRLERGAGRPHIDQLPYYSDKIVPDIAGIAHVVLMGAPPPVTWFAAPGVPRVIFPDGVKIHGLASPEHDVLATLKMLAEAVHAPPLADDVMQVLNPPPPQTGDLTAEKIWFTLVANMPEQTILCDEGVSSSRASWKQVVGAPQHDLLGLTGGAIGSGMSLATGAALACPDRQVINTEGDGSGMYVPQALWTQARQNLNVVTVIFANHGYDLIRMEMLRAGLDPSGSNSNDMRHIRDPKINWVQLANGMGVNASSASTAEAFTDQLKAALAAPGPHLIEALI